MKVTKETKTIVDITITMSELDASYILDILGRISCSADSPVDRLYHRLYDAGVREPGR